MCIFHPQSQLIFIALTIASVTADVSHLLRGNGYDYPRPQQHQGYSYPKPSGIKVNSKCDRKEKFKSIRFEKKSDLYNRQRRKIC